MFCNDTTDLRKVSASQFSVINISGMGMCIIIMDTDSMKGNGDLRRLAIIQCPLIIINN